MTNLNTLSTDEISAVAQEAYIYAFPMLMGYRFGYASFPRPGKPRAVRQGSDTRSHL